MLLATLLILSETKIVDLKDGFVRVDTPSYTVEVPKGWEVTPETRFGQREFNGKTGNMSAMTAPGGGRQGWDRLYNTSLYFIGREMDAKPTPYKLGKTKQGYETASWSMLDKDGFAKARYVILKASNDNILALSVKIPDRKQERDLQSAFTRLVETAKLK